MIRLAPLVASIILLIMVFGILVMMKARRRRSKWIEIDAEIVEIEQQYRKGGTFYVHIYKYEYNGIEYKTMDNIGSVVKNGRIGSRVKIKVDENNPNLIKRDIEFKELSTLARIIIVILIIVICIVGVMFLL